MVLIITITVLALWFFGTQCKISQVQGSIQDKQIQHELMIEALEKEQERQAAQLAKHEAQINNLYFKMEKAEDEIAHFTELADRLEEQKAEALEEIETINCRLEHADGVLDPLNAREDDRFNVSPTNADGALLYMDMYSSTLDDKRTTKQKQTDAEKLRKRKATLESKIIRLDNQIFSAEQHIKKAIHDRDTAKMQIEA